MVSPLTSLTPSLFLLFTNHLFSTHPLRIRPFSISIKCCKDETLFTSNPEGWGKCHHNLTDTIRKILLYTRYLQIQNDPSQNIKNLNNPDSFVCKEKVLCHKFQMETIYNKVGQELLTDLLTFTKLG